METIGKISGAWWLLIFLVTGLLGCVPLVLFVCHVDAASYQPIPDGSSFTVVSSGEPTLTERHVQDIIKIEMTKRGFILANSSPDAEFAVMYSYSVHRADVISSRADFVLRGQIINSTTAYPPHSWDSGLYPGFSYFMVSIVDLAKSRERGQLTFAWTIDMHSAGSEYTPERTRDPSWVADRFLPKLFEQFGKTIKENVWVM